MSHRAPASPATTPKLPEERSTTARRPSISTEKIPASSVAHRFGAYSLQPPESPGSGEVAVQRRPEAVIQRQKLIWDVRQSSGRRKQPGTTLDYAALDRQIRAAKIKPLPANPEDIYDQLGPDEKWREHIDAAHHRFGRDVYVEGKHGKKPDPHYNRAMMDADRHIRSTFGRRLTFDDYDAVHTLATVDPTDQYAHGFRRGELPIGTRQNKFNAPVETLEAENVSPFGGASGLPPLVKSFEPAHAEERAKVTLTDVVGDEDPRKVYGEAVNRMLDAYYERVGDAQSDAEKLQHIAHLHRSLENLHPYGDANTRTNRLVLNRMLAEQGLPLTMLAQPLDVHHTSEAKWLREIERGQKRWSRTVADKTAGHDTQADWKGWEEGLKTKTRQHDLMPDSVLKQETPRPTRFHTDAPQVSAYSAPLEQVKKPKPEPEAETKMPSMGRAELLEALVPKVKSMGLSLEGLQQMSTEQLQDLHKTLSL